VIDGPADIDLEWFSSPIKGDITDLSKQQEPAPIFRSSEETVLVTAGASAPESLVQECVSLLREHFGASVETRMIRQEQLRFALPKPLRRTP
jgi:4-hydroxy-3-methylbut-2-enyl diphosphate reductase IspH